MRKQFTWIIWFALLVMSALSPLWGTESVFLNQVFAQDLDPTQWFVFMSLGLFPLYFFILALNDKQPWPRACLYLLGMILGGFVIFPLDALSKAVPQPLSKPTFMILALMDITLVGMFVWAMITGDWSVYMQSYRSDLFVYVMTWDMLAFIGVLLAKIAFGAPQYFKVFEK